MGGPGLYLPSTGAVGAGESARQLAGVDKALVILLGPCSLFYDEQVPLAERRRLFRVSDGQSGPDQAAGGAVVPAAHPAAPGGQPAFRTTAGPAGRPGDPAGGRRQGASAAVRHPSSAASARRQLEGDL